MPVELVESALSRLMQPDPRSRSAVEDGRRIILLDPPREWGWLIVNHMKYRRMQNAEDRREYHREYWRANRSKQDHSTGSTNTQTDQQTQLSAYASTSTSEVKKKKDEIEAHLKFVAKRIHGRHPSIRRCGLPAVESKLRVIIRSVPEQDQIAVLDYIDSQHELHCKSEAWLKDGGAFVKGLEAWLNPLKRLWENDPSTKRNNKPVQQDIYRTVGPDDE